MAALHYNTTSGFEAIHGLLDRTMELLEVNRVNTGDTDGYYIKGTTTLTTAVSETVFQPVRTLATSLVDALIFLFGEKRSDQWVLFIQIR